MRTCLLIGADADQSGARYLLTVADEVTEMILIENGTHSFRV